MSQQIQDPQTPWDITVTDLKRMIDAKMDLLILDVRQEQEYDICNIGGTCIPLDQLPSRYSELDQNAEIIVHCKYGNRSAQAVHALRESGFIKVRNLNGGIMAWASEIDPEMPTY